MSKESKVRIYVVKDHEGDEIRLVRATSAAQAIRHCTTHYTAKVASQNDLVALLENDVDVENAAPVA